MPNGLGEVLAVPAATIYERVRKLVGGGLLQPAEQERGPGGGVRATPSTVATLLIAMMATDSLSKVAARTRVFQKLRNTEGETFLDALTDILSKPVKIAGVRVQRDFEQAMVLHGESIVTFSKPGRSPLEPKEFGLFSEVSIYSKSLQAIADILGRD